MKKIAIFASGAGSNAQNIAEYFRNNERVKIECVLSNKTDAYVLERAKNLEIDTLTFSRDDFYNGKNVLHFLQLRGVDFIVLAGFLWLIPGYMLDAYNGRIINIHPALLPKYGGKGMYGMKVHQAVVAAHEIETGITIHHVNAKYDEGDIIFQAKCPVLDGDTPEMVAQKVHRLEYEYYPGVIEKMLEKL
ncbi:MAG: phosphoribosylglycinamide formyltransferase [Bacteroidales bacterium]|nr:phosphoribosylglycinamide formyltransferase [Bacteroidales bacterium]